MDKGHILAGICIDDIGAGDNKEDRLMNIYTNFNLAMKRLLVLSQKYVPDNEYMRTITRMVKYGDKYIPTRLIQKTYKNLLDPGTSQCILDRNMQYFLNKNFNNYIKDDEYSKPLHFIIEFLKTNFHQLPEKDLEYVWDLTGIMLVCCDEYVKHINKYG